MSELDMTIPPPSSIVPTPTFPAAPLFDGHTYDEDRDRERLSTLLGRVYEAMHDTDWWTLAELARHTGGSEASVSARLRDLRKPRFGGHTVQRTRTLLGGLYHYRLIPSPCGLLDGTDRSMDPPKRERSVGEVVSAAEAAAWGESAEVAPSMPWRATQRPGGAARTVTAVADHRDAVFVTSGSDEAQQLTTIIGALLGALSLAHKWSGLPDDARALVAPYVPDGWWDQ